MFKNILALALLVSAPVFAADSKKQVAAQSKKIVVLNNQSSVKDLPKKAALYVYDNVVFAAKETVDVVRNHKTATAVIVLATLKASHTDAAHKASSYFSVDTLRAGVARAKALFAKKANVSSSQSNSPRSADSSSSSAASSSTPADYQKLD